MGWVYTLVLVSWVLGTPTVTYVPLGSYATRAECVRAGRLLVEEEPLTPPGSDQILFCKQVFEQEA